MSKPDLSWLDDLIKEDTIPDNAITAKEFANLKGVEQRTGNGILQKKFMAGELQCGTKLVDGRYVKHYWPKK